MSSRPTIRRRAGARSTARAGGFALAVALLVGACGSTDSPVRAEGPATLETLSHEGGPVTQGIPWSSPAVSSLDGTTIYFNDWDGTSTTGTPSIGQHDVATGERSTFAQGAVAPVVRTDGTVAFARGVRADYRVDRPYPTEIVVREGAQDKVWLSPTEYSLLVPVAWAAETLVVLRISPTTGAAETVLVRDGAVKELEGLPLAISPDGAAVLSSTDRSDPNQLLVVTDSTSFELLDAVGYEEYATAFLPGSGEENFDPADLRPGPEGWLPVAPVTNFGIWRPESLVLQAAKGLLVFDTASDGGWNVTPRAFLPINRDQPSTVGMTTASISPLPNGDVAVVVELVDEAKAITGPPPEQMTRTEAEALGAERAQSRADATSAQAYRCELEAQRCQVDPSMRDAGIHQSQNHSR